MVGNLPKAEIPIWKYRATLDNKSFLATVSVPFLSETKMKILALHGHGTSGAILRSQLTPLMQLATDRNYDFVFVDGDYECEKAPGMNPEKSDFDAIEAESRQR